MEGVSRPFLRHVTLREPVQLVVNDGHELLKRAVVAFAPGVKQLRYL